MREKIETSGRDQRWEFDKRRLFDRTNYMAMRCSDIIEASQALDHFNNIMGPQLKAVTGDAVAIDSVLKRVEHLVLPLEAIPFDLFDKRFQASWDAVMHRFRTDVTEIEEMTKSFINASFKTLRSAEGAFDVLTHFTELASRDSLNKQVMEKFIDILHQFMKEVDGIRVIFDANKDNPPSSKNQTPVAGAVQWSR